MLLLGRRSLTKPSDLSSYTGVGFGLKRFTPAIDSTLEMNQLHYPGYPNCFEDRNSNETFGNN